jgi:excisionase family DNA binding protein
MTQHRRQRRRSARPGRISVRAAGKLVGVSRSRVREWIEQGKLAAYRTGGSDDAPHLEVDVKQLHAVADRETLYLPKAMQDPPSASSASPRRGPGRPPGIPRRTQGIGNLHPAVMGMLTHGATRD